MVKTTSDIRHPTSERHLTSDIRLLYIDHLRGFMFIIMALDHSLHAYAEKFGRLWFFKDVDRNSFFDMMYVFDQSMIMPMIFFIIGMFVISSIHRRGLFSFAKERLIRIGIPFVIGVPFIVPLLTYPRYEYNERPEISYWDFWTEHYFSEALQGGPFWVMYAILLYTTILVAVYYWLPPLYRLGVRAVQCLVARPAIGYVLFGLTCATLLAVSDWLWGAFGWIGFGKIFKLQASRILLVILYFFTGAFAVSAGIFQNNQIMDRLVANWGKLGILVAVIGAAYMIDCVYFFDLAYGAYDSATSQQYLPGIILRNILLGFLGLSQVLFLLATFKKFFSKPTRAWTSLACNAWGIFIIHESIVVWMQYSWIDSSISPFSKFMLVAVVGISVAWLLSDLLRRIPGFKRVLGPQIFK